MSVQNWIEELDDIAAMVDAGEDKNEVYSAIETLKLEMQKYIGIADDGKRFVVWHYDGMDNEWMKVSKPVPYKEAKEIWNRKTKNGTEFTRYENIDYFTIEPINGVMEKTT